MRQYDYYLHPNYPYYPIAYPYYRLNYPSGYNYCRPSFNPYPVFIPSPQANYPYESVGYWSYGTNEPQRTPDNIQVSPRQPVTEEYEPYIKYAVASQLLQDKVLPLLQKGQSQLPNDTAVNQTMSDIDAAFQEAINKLDPLHDPKAGEVGKFLSMVKGDFFRFFWFDLRKPSDKWRNFAEVAKTAVEIMKLIAPGMVPQAVPVSYMVSEQDFSRQLGPAGLTLVTAVIAAGAALIVATMTTGADMMSKYGKYIAPMNDCFQKYAHLIPPAEIKGLEKQESKGWKEVENCLKNVYKLTAQEIPQVMYYLKEAYQQGIKQGTFMPKPQQPHVKPHPKPHKH